MTKLTIIFFISILSFNINAEQEMQFIAMQTQNQSPIELILASNESGNANLWEILDTNKDGFLSKAEATFSKEVFESWEFLDSNKNEKLETEEFALIFSQEN